MIRKRIASFVCAGKGIIALRSEVHASVHLAATIIVIAAGFWLNVNGLEWALLILSIGLVWVAEAVNTAVECVVDLASPEHHELAGKSKDVAAGAVLLAALTAASVGIIVFGPHLVLV